MEYQPGVCNIGPGEQRKRLALGGGSLVAAAVLIAVVVIGEFPASYLLATVFPLYGAAMGILQYRERFCVGFAALGVFDVGAGNREVTDDAAREADRKRAVRLNAKALALGIASAVAVYVAGRLLL
ncbi:hypothetical protein [Haloparvum sedimenti]|uniref:hypothetical protein n=1 Tax=Haloparvum sedimenti TaxID=1678448 RepID=UPI00071E964F|nr:hypothetical protein [Haloparvum sedimenti]